MQHLQPGTTLQGGKYKIEKVLGQGGFGITYLAENTMLEGKVAIKEFFFKDYCSRDEATSHVTIATTGNSDMVERFKQKFVKEARNIFKLNHPNIVRILDIFEENGTAYYVMEFAENGSLDSKVKREGYLPESIATRYILQVAEALSYIHQRKMNHLDVKPANIMLNGEDNAILIDFGLSKQYDAATGSQTSTTPVGISEGYAPMEQYKQGGVQEFTPETDIYALGATFYKLLTGMTPPSASDVYEDGVPVEELRSRHVSQPTIDVITKAMEPRRKDRINDVRYFGNTQRTSAPADQQEETSMIDNSPSEGTRLINDVQSGNQPGEPRQDSLSADIIRKKAMEQYLAEKKAREEKEAIEAEIQRIKEEEQRLAKEREEKERKEREEREEREEKERKEREEAERKLHGEIINIKGVKYYLKEVAGGSFEMSEEIYGGFLNLSIKKITQKVNLPSYYIGETQVTQALWKAVMGNNPSNFTEDQLPVEDVSWQDCKTFISKLNEMTGKKFRLPTEAEWEFAARGGQKSKGYEYSGSNSLDDVAWYDDNSQNTTHRVASKQPNELGIYDMSGNVWEWCNDYYGDYINGVLTNPTGPETGTNMVIRGGSWGYGASRCRSTTRYQYARGGHTSNIGLRLALTK